MLAAGENDHGEYCPTLTGLNSIIVTKMSNSGE